MCITHVRTTHTHTHTHTPHTHTHTPQTHTQNAFQVPSSLTPVHLMSLEALYAVMTTIQSGNTPTPFFEAQPSSQYFHPITVTAPPWSTPPPHIYKGVWSCDEGGGGPPLLKVLHAFYQKKKVLLPWYCHGINLTV